MQTLKSHADFPTVLKICQRLESHGFQALLAGGCVRDGLLQKTPNDFDVATNARPEQVLAIFPHCLEIGKAFGVIVVIDGEVQVEVTSFRSDFAYLDGRHPSEIHFSSPEKDAHRRDFTMNALFYDLKNNKVLDYVGGVEDIKAGVIKAVGDPDQRFQEDHLRMLRAIRFVGQLGFKLEKSTSEAMVRLARLSTQVSAERVHQELEKLLGSEFSLKALELFDQMSFTENLFPGRKLQNKNWLLKQQWQKSNDILWHWFLFFNAMWEPQLTLSELESYLKEFKFSNQSRQQILNMFRWRTDANTLLKKPLGELIDLCFDPLGYKAFQIYSEQQMLPQDLFEKVTIRLQAFQFKKPQELIKSQDLISKVQGKALGLALKESYWAQLEGKISDQHHAIIFLKNKKLI